MDGHKLYRHAESVLSSFDAVTRMTGVVANSPQLQCTLTEGHHISAFQPAVFFALEMPAEVPVVLNRIPQDDLQRHDVFELAH